MSVEMTGSIVGGGNKTHVASVKFELNEQAFKTMNERMKKGVWAMAYGVRERAMFRAPVLTGALYNTIRVEPMTEDGIEIAAGGLFGTGFDGITRMVSYAYTREMSNNKHPDKAHYMEFGLRDVLESDYQQTYFKGVAQ